MKRIDPLPTIRKLIRIDLEIQALRNQRERLAEQLIAIRTMESSDSVVRGVHSPLKDGSSVSVMFVEGGVHLDSKLVRFFLMKNLYPHEDLQFPIPEGREKFVNDRLIAAGYAIQHDKRWEVRSLPSQEAKRAFREARTKPAHGTKRLAKKAVSKPSKRSANSL